MTDKSLAYVKKLMIAADHADGNHDKMLNKKDALEYIEILRKRAQDEKCPAELEHLNMVKTAVENMKDKPFKSPEWGGALMPEKLINNELKKELGKSEAGKKLLTWYTDHPEDTGTCNISYSVPPKKSPAQQR